MQVNFKANNTYKQNFGMAIHAGGSDIQRLLRSRIKKADDLKRLNSIVDAQAKNDKIDITLFAQPDGKTLSANVYAKETYVDPEKNFFKSYKENPLTRFFHGPLEFIEKLAVVADKQAKKMREADLLNYDDVFSKM